VCFHDKKMVIPDLRFHGTGSRQRGSRFRGSPRAEQTKWSARIRVVRSRSEFDFLSAVPHSGEANIDSAAAVPARIWQSEYLDRDDELRPRPFLLVGRIPSGQKYEAPVTSSTTLAARS